MTLQLPTTTIFPYRRSSDLRIGETPAQYRSALAGIAQREESFPRRHPRALRFASPLHIACGKRTHDSGNQHVGKNCQGTAGSSDRKSTRLNSSHLGISYAVF